jgi:hypothetical protein
MSIPQGGIMKRKLFGIVGALAVLLMPGLVLAGCDNGSTNTGYDDGSTDAWYDNGPTNKDEYHLRWGVTYTTYSTIRFIIIDQNWTVTAQGSNYALATGSTARSVYNYCMNNVSWIDGGDFDGSFEECANFSKDGVSAPSGLKSAGNNNKGNIPLAGVFDGGSGAVLFYITKN